jgi:hypothetical protein
VTDSPVEQSTITFIGVSVIFFLSCYEAVVIPSEPLSIPYKLIVEPATKLSLKGAIWIEVTAEALAQSPADKVWFEADTLFSPRLSIDTGFVKVVA